MTFTRALGTNNYGPCKFIVDGTTVANGTHSTIAAAITSAVSGDTIFIRPGAYTENLTMKPGVTLTSLTGNEYGSTIITGKMTFTTAGSYFISNLFLQTNSDNIAVCSGSSAIGIYFENCEFYVVNATGINLSNANATTLLYGCKGLNITNANAFFAVSAGILDIYYLYHNTDTLGTSTVSGGTVRIYYSQLTTAITTSSTGAIGLIAIHMPLGNICITHGGSGTSSVINSNISGGSSSAISIGTGATLTLVNSTINSSNTNAITGIGTIVYSGLSFSSTSSNINTTTQTVLANGPSRTIGSSNTGATNTLLITNSSNTASSNALENISVGGTSAGDPFTTYTVSGTTNWSQGIDNSVTGDPYVLAASTALGTTNVMSATTAGEINYPLQPAFLVLKASSDTNVTGDGTAVTGMTFSTEIFDQNNDFASSQFTCPITSRCMFNVNLTLTGLGALFTTVTITLVTSNRTYFLHSGGPGYNATGNATLGRSEIADMDAADTAFVSVTVSGSTKTVSLYGDGTPATLFAGYIFA